MRRSPRRSAETPPTSADAGATVVLSEEADNRAYLLQQDDTIPGNKKDGFRFHYLIFVMIATPAYLWLELSFGVRLLDNISSSTGADQTAAIEHWGRLISGCAVALLFLSQWFAQCEKWDRPVALRLIVAVVIVAISIPLTWSLQGTIIDFYVEEGSTEVAIAVPLIVAAFALGLYGIRRWLRTYGQRRTGKPLITISVLVVLLLATGLAIFAISRVVPWAVAKWGDGPPLAERLGKERQQAATLSLIRRGMQVGAFTLRHDHSKDLTQSVFSSPEGKATLSLFPVVGSVGDQTRFIAERPRVLKEVMYIDWDEQYGEHIYGTYLDLRRELTEIYEKTYVPAQELYQREYKALGPARARAHWNATLGAAMEDIAVDPGLNADEFLAAPGVAKFIAKRFACFDCQFRADMTREEFNYEIFLSTRMDSVNSALSTLEDESHFASGRDGEAAARTYWVPIWALLFSMIGAFTHIFKMMFSAAEYAYLRAFHKVHAADSRLAMGIVRITQRGMMATIVAIMLFIYFSENRITDQSGYKMLHAKMLEETPLIGGIAAHWTINAQGIIYPFTKKLRPEWLTFNDDPFDHPPLSMFSSWVTRDY